MSTGALSRLAGRAALLVVAAGLMTACPPAGRDAPADALTSAEDVLALAGAYRGSGPTHAILEARASQYNDHGGLKGKVEILVERPGRVRFTGLSPTDDLVSVLASDGERFVAFERGQKVCYVGRACPANVGRFTGFVLAGDDLVGVLLGRPPIVPHEQATLAWDRAAGTYRVELVGTAAALGGAKGQLQRVWVRHDDGRIVRMQVIEGTTTLADVRYSEWKTVDGKLLPGRIDVKAARDHTDLRIDFRDIDLTTPLEAKAFEFTCPAGAALEDQPCFSE